MGKMKNVRKTISKLLKTIEQLMVNNDDKEGRMIEQISELMKYIK